MTDLASTWSCTSLSAALDAYRWLFSSDILHAKHFFEVSLYQRRTVPQCTPHYLVTNVSARGRDHDALHMPPAGPQRPINMTCTPWLLATSTIG